METKTPKELKDGDECTVVGGAHNGKAGTVHDIKASKTLYDNRQTGERRSIQNTRQKCCRSIGQLGG